MSSVCGQALFDYKTFSV